MREKEIIDPELGHRIQVAREYLGLTQDTLSEMIGMGQKNLSNVEGGRVGISVNTLKRICRALSVSSDSLLFGAPPQNDQAELSERLANLPPARFSVAKRQLAILLEAFALGRP